MGQFCYSFLYSWFKSPQYMHSHSTSLTFPVPMCFRCSCPRALSCNTAVIIIIIILSFIAILSMIAISSLNDQCSCRSFDTSVLVDGQPQSMDPDEMSLCSSYSIPNIISSVIMQSGMSIPKSIALMVMPMLGTSLCPFHGCAWINSLKFIDVAQACIIFFCFIVVFLLVFLKAYMMSFQHHS